ncbi:MAG: adenylate/guanylate cyclase domain-containing protein [Betaproteobacteria bacterium]|nr:adenylate/guanylate cyclase domain-containing protein [Betaproteobacteria bacterium]
MDEALLRDALRLYAGERAFARLEASGRAALMRDLEVVEATVLVLELHSVRGDFEHLSPRDVSGLLNDYLDHMTNKVLTHGGEISDYQGAALTAHWRASADARHAARACAAALGCHDEAQALVQHAGVSLITWAGVASGKVSFGNLGSSTRLKYCALGPPVSDAFRLAAANGMFGTRTLAAEATIRGLGEEVRYVFRDEVALKGVAQPLRVYEILAPVAGEKVFCQKCGQDVTDQANGALGDAQFGGYNVMSIQYAQPWSDEAKKQFLQTYVCKKCKELRHS